MPDYIGTIKRLGPLLATAMCLSAPAIAGELTALDPQLGATMNVQEGTPFPETHDGPWDPVGAGCSYYCAVERVSLTASSALPPQGANRYDAASAHDSDLRTAWVEGEKDGGLGKSLTLTVTGSKPTQLTIYNGYQKSPKHYRNNGRVKQLRLLLNGEPKALLNLSDSRAAQEFEIGNLYLPEYKYGEDAATVTIELEIVAVYPGAKWQDTAISEIVLQGESH
jgi:hypothetical protein